MKHQKDNFHATYNVCNTKKRIFMLHTTYVTPKKKIFTLHTTYVTPKRGFSCYIQRM